MLTLAPGPNVVLPCFIVDSADHSLYGQLVCDVSFSTGWVLGLDGVHRAAVNHLPTHHAGQQQHLNATAGSTHWKKHCRQL
jgi:hypothetical protein